MSVLLRSLLLAGCLIVGAAIESAWLSRLSVRFGPDLLALVVLAVGLRKGVVQGAVVGAATGYLRDLSGGSPLGVYALTYLLAGTLAGTASPMVDLRQRAMPAVVAAAGTVVVVLVSGGIVAATGAGAVTWSGMLAAGAGAAALNAALARPVDSVVRWIDRLEERRYAGRLIGRGGLR